MKRFKTYITEAKKYGSIYNNKPKTTKEALDPEVYVHGVATYRYSQVKEMVANKLKALESEARLSIRSDRLEYGESHLHKIQNNLIHFVGALADVQKEMKTSQWKRKITMLKNQGK